MNLRRTIQLAEPAKPVIVIVHTPEQPAVEGKFIVGRTSVESAGTVLVFDTQCAFHRDIGVKYGLRALGGGWCKIDHDRKEVWIGGKSTQFGVEPDRNLTLNVLSELFPTYLVDRDD